MKKITVIGSLNMDISITTPEIPEIGETILGSGLQISPGGKGANQAVAAARLGGRVTMVGCIGDDVFGQTLLHNLLVNEVDTNYIIKTRGISTGVAVIVVKDGNNSIIVDPGANHELKPGHIQNLERLISNSSIVIIQLEIPMETVEEAVKIAGRHKIPILLNPAPAGVLSDELLRNIDILTPNESECEYITGLRVKSVEDAKKAVCHLNGKGVKQVLVTLGAKGVVYNNGNNLVHKPVPEVKVVDTTAAGDSFSGALAVALVSGMDIDDAVDFANIVGMLAVTKKGAQSSLPTIKEVEMYKNCNTKESK